MSKHTPGPWSDRNGRIFKTDHQELTIANVGRAFDGDYSPANARLIAAAPDLLEALRKALPAIVQCERAHRNIGAAVGQGEFQRALDAALAAIAKAEGKTHEH